MPSLKELISRIEEKLAPVDPDIRKYCEDALLGKKPDVMVGTKAPEVADIYPKSARLRIPLREMPDGKVIERSFLIKLDENRSIVLTDEGTILGDGKDFKPRSKAQC